MARSSRRRSSSRSGPGARSTSSPGSREDRDRPAPFPPRHKLARLRPVPLAARRPCDRLRGRLAGGVMTVELVPLECGWIRQAGSLLEVGASDAPLDTPIPAWLIRHPKETVLFDTGLHPDLARSSETLRRLASLFTAMR